MKRFSYEYFRDLAQIISFLILTFSLGAIHIFSKEFTTIVIVFGFISIFACAILMTVKEIKKR